MENRKRALGRGLEELFNSDNLDLDAIEKQIYETATREEIVELNIDELRPNPYQPRKVFNEEALQELADSIKEHGVFQPIIVKKSIKGYEIIAGERRVRASKLAGLKTIPAIIRDFSDAAMIEIALLENLQRENLNVIEEALAYRTMIEKLGLTQEQLSARVGKSRSHITNIIGLLRLPFDVQKQVADGKISMGHARVLSKLEDKVQIAQIAKQIIENDLSVRQIEELVSSNEYKRANVINKKEKENKNEYKYVEDLLRDKLDTKVKLKDNKIIISFNNVADLNRILEILNIKE